MARITPFARQMDIAKSNLVGEGRRRHLIEVAQRLRDDALENNARILGRRPDYETVVDGIKGAAEENVRLGGTIVYLFQIGGQSMAEAVRSALDLVRRLSPKLTGRYRDTHRVLVNGFEISTANPEALDALKETDIVAVVNLQPYARRIERGWSKQAPNGVYEVAAGMLKSRFGNLLKIGFTYDRYPGFGAGKFQTKRGRKAPLSVKRSEQFPTILLQAK